MRCLLLSVILALIVEPPGVSAQSGTPSLEPGARVRVTRLCRPPLPALSEPPCRLTGRVVEVGADTLVVEAGGRLPARYGLETIDQLELSLGRRTQARRGAIAGTVVGGLATYLTLFTGGSTAMCDESANQDAAGSGACLGILASGGLAGAGLGFLVGGLIRTEVWRDLPIPESSFGVSRGQEFWLRVRWRN